MADTTDISAILPLPLHQRLWAYLRLTGPGYLQSALTLGGASIAACVYFGSLAGYELLWVQPLSMLLGYFVMAAVAKIVCNNDERPYRIFWLHLSPLLALVWAMGALTATVIWHFPQYSVTANGVISLAEGLGINLDSGPARAFIGLVVLGAAAGVIAMYNRGARGIRHFEFAVKILVWTVVFSFALVALVTGIQWKQLILGVTGISFIRDVLDGGIEPALVQPIVAGMAAVTGINMFFLYAYALRGRGWGKQHTELAYFDLVTGMAIPFIVATGFVVIGVANTIGPEAGVAGEPVKDIRAIVPVLGPTFGELLGNSRWGDGIALFLIGTSMVAIGFSTIVTHMLSCSFIGCEVFNLSHSSRARFWFALLPAIGVAGVAARLPWQTAITASSINALLMPIAVLCFIVLLNRERLMKGALPLRFRRVLWNVSLITCLIVMAVAAWYGMRENLRILRENYGTREPAAAVEADHPYRPC